MLKSTKEETQNEKEQNTFVLNDLGLRKQGRS